jgi:hypothetical protein
MSDPVDAELLRKIYKELEEWDKVRKLPPPPPTFIESLRELLSGCFGRLLLIALILILISLIYHGCNDNSAVIVPTRQGAACMGTGNELQLKTISYWTIHGSIASLNGALAEAKAECAKLNKECIGECDPAERCAPGLAVQSAEVKWRLFWSTTEVTYICPCSCGK